MKISEIWHFSFTVKDLERSVAFYQDLLGMEVVHRQVGNNPYTRTLVGFPDAHIKVALLRIPGGPEPRSGHVLELIQYVSPQGEKIDTRTCNPGTAHMCFVVDDIQSAYAALKAKGVRFKSEPVAITEGRNKGGYSVYFLDPDDITLELHQPAPGR